MKALDYFDFLMHGTPWFLLVRLGLMTLYHRLKENTRLQAHQD